MHAAGPGRLLVRIARLKIVRVQLQEGHVRRAAAAKLFSARRHARLGAAGRPVRMVHACVQILRWRCAQ